MVAIFPSCIRCFICRDVYDASRIRYGSAHRVGDVFRAFDGHYGLFVAPKGKPTRYVIFSTRLMLL